MNSLTLPSFLSSVVDISLTSALQDENKEWFSLAFDNINNKPVFLSKNKENNLPHGRIVYPEYPELALISSYTAHTLLQIKLNEKDSNFGEELDHFIKANNIPYQEWGEIAEYSDGYYSPTKANLALNIISASYPIYTRVFPNELVNDGFYSSPFYSERFLGAMHSTGYREFIETLFGSYRKDAARQLGASKSSAMQISWATLFVKNLPIEYLLSSNNKIMADTFGAGGTFPLSRLENFFDHFARSQIKKWYQEEEGNLKLLDTMRMFESLEGNADEKIRQLPKKTSLANLHNYLTLASKKMSGSKKFDIPSEIKALNSIDTGDYVFRVLDTPDKYAKMGEEMENCVGNIEYALDTIAGDGYILHITDQKAENYLIELRRTVVPGKYSVRQFYGIKNAKVSKDIETSLTNLILNTIERNANVYSVS